MFNKTEVEIASTSLFDYFVRSPDEAIRQAKSSVTKLCAEWRGMAGTGGIAKETFNWLWSKAKPTQLANLEAAYSELGEITDTSEPQSGVAALSVIVDLFDKSESKNWSDAERGIGGPSLNNRLATELLAYSGRLSSDSHMLALNSNGVMFVNFLRFLITGAEAKFRERNTIHITSPRLPAPPPPSALVAPPPSVATVTSGASPPVFTPSWTGGTDETGDPMELSIVIHGGGSSPGF